MADQPEKLVSFKVTRPKTLVYHPTVKRFGAYRGPFQDPRTGVWSEPDTLENVPEAWAKKQEENGVGEVVQAEKPVPVAEKKAAPASRATPPTKPPTE